jgi:hypothetical protein
MPDCDSNRHISPMGGQVVHGMVRLYGIVDGGSMQKRQGFIWFVGAWLNPTLVVLLISLLCRSIDAWAGDWTDTGTSLENADGIRLQPTLSLVSDSSPRRGDSSRTDVDPLDSDFASTPGGLTSLMAKRTSGLWARRPNLGGIFNGANFIRLESDWLNSLSLISAAQEVRNTSILSSPDRPWSNWKVRKENLIRKTFLLETKYNLTQAWSAGVSVPMRPFRTGLAARETLLRDGAFPKLVQNLRPQSDLPMAAGSGEGMGAEDIRLRTEYSLLQLPSRWPQIAMGGQLKLPSKDNFLGMEQAKVETYLAAYQDFGPLTSYVDLSCSWAGADFRQNSLSYSAGLSAQAHPSLILGLDTWGYWIPNWHGSGNHAASLLLWATWNALRILSLYSDIMLPMIRTPDIPPEIIWTISLKYRF